MAKADAEPRGPEVPAEPRGPGVHIEQAIGRLYRFLAGNRWTRFPWAVVQTFSKAEGALLSGSMAYYTFLSLLPLLMVAAFVLATFATPGPDARATVAEALNQVFPGIGAEVFEEVINQVVANRAALGVFGLLSVAYAGSGFVGSMPACLNRMWRGPAGPHPGGPTSPVISMIEEVAAPASMLVVLLLLYRLLPARPHSWLSQIPGAFFGGVGFYLLKRGFDFWASHSDGISALPRSLVSVTLLLVWLGFFGQLILYGAALNVVLDRRRRGEPIMPEAPEAVTAAADDDGARAREG